jgi:uncharacterized protein YndB with AHSA1/START domain/catechol 2,3-dioxygenase-like lactoylglutathione lyase family enzyme
MTAEIVNELRIAAPPATVFAALTEPEELMAWWGDPTLCPATHWELDLRPGGRWLSRWRSRDGTEFALGGEVVEVRAPALLVYTWWDDRYPDLARTTVRWELTAADGGTRVRVTHGGFAGRRPDFVDYDGGWPGVLEKLRSRLEGAPAFRANRDVAIEVADLAAAEAFYAGTLGFRVVSRGEGQLALDTGALTLWVSRATGAATSFVPSLTVPDARAARATLEGAGCRVVREEAAGSGFYFADPFGLVIDVIEAPANEGDAPSARGHG